ncbi:MAG: hypothetical protein JRI44_06645 [Deltaproteobacteria bacterium]|nr:hypothetical protein [Deltaproteobacteria bacterium]
MKRYILLLLIIPFLIISCGKKDKEKKEIAKRIPNHPPSVVWVRIKPNVLYPSSDIKAEVKAQDPDGDKVSLSYRWFINNELLNDKKDNHPGILPLNEGDVIKVVVTPFDGRKKGKPIAATKSVPKRTPVVTSIIITPKNPTVKNRLIAKVAVAIFDGKKITTYHYQWYKNDEPIPGADKVYLDPLYFKKGDKISVKVTPENEDGVMGISGKTKPVTIQNSPPVITSKPKFIESKNEEGIYLYQVKAKDPDNDKLMISLKGDLPKGISIDKNGLIKWDTKKSDPKKKYKIIIRVDDGDGGICEQSFSLVPPKVKKFIKKSF